MTLNLHRPTRRTAVAVAVALVALTAVVGLGPGRGIGAAPQHLWTEQPPAVSPAKVEAPNWVDLAKALKPAVVNVSVKKAQGGPGAGAPDDDSPFGDFFRQFRGMPTPPHSVRGLGSGFIISPNGDIVTNNHVVDGAHEIKVTMSNGREFTAKVVGRDAKTDLALIRIDATGLPVIPLGNSDELLVGQPVMAIGNPFGLEQTVTTGIVSATGRVIGEGPYDDFIQTDAAINPGNSGGPLINGRGQAVGINTAIFSRSGGSVGVSFAIPINLAKTVVTQLAESGKVTRGWLGVTIQRVTPDLAKTFNLPAVEGALITAVSQGSPAAKAGLKDGDVIVEYNGKKVARSDELPRAVAETPLDHQVPVTVIRDGQRVTVNARIARLGENEERTPVTTARENSAPLGLSVQSLTPDVATQLGLDTQHGVLVRAVRDDSPAADAGFKAGDIIIAVDRHPVKTVEDMQTALTKHDGKSPRLFLVRREGGNVYLTMS
jgi:serine protease Do